MTDLIPDMQCVRCDRGCVVVRRWNTPDRPAFKAAGFRRYGCRGLCTACLQYLRTNGGVEAYAIGVKPTGIAGAALRHSCTRCGIGVPTRDQLCPDCHLVATDLDELEAWAEPVSA